jgi:HD-GYP domain-containing protein (c-di-GMP phosphodiesterase class II)
MDGARSRAAVVTLARAIETNHEGTAEHSDDVVRLAVEVGRRMGLGVERLDDLALAAQLHDVGKIGVPQAILDKPGPLDEQETAVIQRHPDIGADLVERLPWLAPLADEVRAMHERWDGDGYPRGLAGEDIPRLARIVFACDAYCAMCQDRPYRRARSHEQAIGELHRCAGSQFDPDVIAVLGDVLTDGRA